MDTQLFFRDYLLRSFKFDRFGPAKSTSRSLSSEIKFQSICDDTTGGLGSVEVSLSKQFWGGLNQPRGQFALEFCGRHPGTVLLVVRNRKDRRCRDSYSFG